MASRILSVEADEVIRERIKKEAMSHCQVEQVAFVECSKKGKLYAITQCRQHLAALNNCLSQ
jgi:hypothetical protein